MALFLAEDHAANPPETWIVRKAADRCWHLTPASGEGVLGTFPRKRDAEMARTIGWWVDLYEKERRWYAGEAVAGWKPYVAGGAYVAGGRA